MLRRTQSPGAGESHHIFFQLVLFPSLEEFSTYTENAEGRSPHGNHESHVLDGFPRITDPGPNGERKKR